MEKEEKVKPKFKGVTFGRLLITSNEIKTASGLILADVATAPAKHMSDVQTVVGCGPMVKAENGIDLVPGDRIMIDVSNPKIGIPIAFNKVTGELSGPTDTENTCDIYYLIESRSVLMVL